MQNQLANEIGWPEVYTQQGQPARVAATVAGPHPARNHQRRSTAL
jgi:hypothetical protein